MLSYPDLSHRLSSPHAAALHAQMCSVIDESILPLETQMLAEPFKEDGTMAVDESIEGLRQEARAAGLWNFFMTYSDDGPGLTNVDYALFAERMGMSMLAAEVFNCDAPDSGNMEILHSFAQTYQLRRLYERLAAGECRSAFAMTEADSAGSYPRGLQTALHETSEGLELRGAKWFISGLLFRRCESILVFARDTGAGMSERSFSIVCVPRETPGVRVIRSVPVFGYPARGGHCEVEFDAVRVDPEWILGDRGAGFEVAQSRLGPGRLHHAMRCVGMAERALGLMIERSGARRVAGGLLADKGVVRQWIAESRLSIDQTRELVLATAEAMDAGDAPRARLLTSMIKVAAPRTAGQVIDRAIQVHGSHGLTEDFPLARMWARARSLQFGDGPDEVHLEVIARHELSRLNGPAL